MGLAHVPLQPCLAVHSRANSTASPRAPTIPTTLIVLRHSGSTDLNIAQSQVRWPDDVLSQLLSVHTRRCIGRNG